MVDIQPSTGNRSPYRVVITGGPCSGKTALWNALGERCPGAVKVPEIATAVRLSGRTPESMGWEAFQRLVFQRQQDAEQTALQQGNFLLCDRGLADGLAYFSGLASCLGLSREALLERYTLILHLEVIQDPESYAFFSRNNPTRLEDHEDALSLGRRIGRVYRSHTGYFHLTGSLEQKLTRALEILQDRCPGVGNP
jgi:predicted ATPase